jgi:hypothetical protein
LNYCSIILSYYWAFNWNGPIIFFSIIKQTFSNDCNYLKLISRNSIWTLPSPTNGYLDRRLKKASANSIRKRNWMNVKKWRKKNNFVDQNRKSFVNREEKTFLSNWKCKTKFNDWNHKTSWLISDNIINLKHTW